MLRKKPLGRQLRRHLVLRTAPCEAAKDLRPMHRFLHGTVQTRQSHHAHHLPRAGGDHRLVAGVGFQRQAAGAVGFHQNVVRQFRQLLIGQAAVHQLSLRGAAGGAHHPMLRKSASQIVRRGVGQQGQVVVGQKMGAGAQQHPPRQLTRQRVQQGGFSTASDNGSDAFLYI